jgi:hypothetical protein
MRQIAGQVKMFVSRSRPPNHPTTSVTVVGNRCLMLDDCRDAVVVVLTDTDAQVLMEVLEDPDSVRGRHIQYGNLVIRHVDTEGWVGLSITLDKVCAYIGSMRIHW